MSYTYYEKWKKIPNEETPYLSVVIPAYNEAERIVPTIGAIASHLCDLGYVWELIISDDGSTDETVDLVKGLQLANLQLLIAPQNEGKGSAVRRGMLAAKGKYLLFTDADNSTPIEEINNLLNKLISEEYEIAVGSRAATGALETKKSPLRQILSNGLRWLVNNVFQIKVQDTQCGFKLYSEKVGKYLHQQQTLNGFSFDLEILYLAQKYGFPIAEVPVTWVDAPGSKVDTRKEVQRFLRDLLKIKMNDWRGNYAPAF